MDITAAIEVLKQSKFCTGCELSRYEEKSERYILRIKWTSTKDHVEGFRASPEFKEFLGHARAYFKHAEETRHYTPRNVGFKK